MPDIGPLSPLAPARVPNKKVSTAGGQLTSDQASFAATLAGDTGLNIKVVAAWLLAEESGSAAQGRQSAGNNDWLNIGYTGSGTFGATDSIWSNPVTAANATAQWLAGKNAVPGYGPASSGVQGILKAAGSSVSDQLATIRSSGWAASGYPELASVFQSITHGTINQVAQAPQEKGSTIDTPGVKQIVGGVTGAVTGAVSDASSITNFLGDLTSGKTWLRVLEFVGGLILLGFALLMLARSAGVETPKQTRVIPVPV